MDRQITESEYNKMIKYHKKRKSLPPTLTLTFKNNVFCYIEYNMLTDTAKTILNDYKV